MTTNNSCTIYRKSHVDGQYVYERFFIPKVMVQQRDTVSIKNNGMTDNSGQSKATVIFMPMSSLPSGFCTKNGDILLIGSCSATADENGFGEVTKSDDSMTVISVIKRSFGSEAMQHLEVHCV